MKNTKNIFATILANIIFGLLVLFIILGLLTPDKDKFGNYTQPVAYWTDNVYFESNF